MATHYWVNTSSGIWDSNTFNWSYTSGGAPSGDVPTTSDNVVFDGNSGTALVQIDSGTNCLSFDASAFGGSFELIGNLDIWGTAGLTVGAGVTWVNSFGNYYINFTLAAGSANLDCLVDFGGSIKVDANSDSGGANNLILLSAFSSPDPASYIDCVNGGFDTSSLALTVGSFSVQANTLALIIGDSTITLTGADGYSPYGAVWYIADASITTINANIATTIDLAHSVSTGENITFEIDALNAGGTINYGCNLVISSIPLTNITFHTGGTGGTFSVETFTATTGGHVITFDVDNTIDIVGSFDLSGTSGLAMNTLQSGGEHYFTINSGACWDYVDVTDCNFDVASYAGCHSHDGGNNTNLTFNDCGSPCVTLPHSFGVIL